LEKKVSFEINFHQAVLTGLDCLKFICETDCEVTELGLEPWIVGDGGDALGWDGGGVVRWGLTSRFMEPSPAHPLSCS
jgi:hypothetical protein